MLRIALAVVGGRDFSNYTLMCAKIDAIRARCTVATLVSGGARGADRLAERYARENELPILVLRPDWSLGRGAGLLRNKEIVETADCVLAFWDGRSKGTKNTIERAEKSRKRVTVVRYK